MFCQQRKNVNTASSKKGICRNPITRLWEENSSAPGEKKRGWNGSCASNNSVVFSQMERDSSTASPSGCGQGQESGHAQRKVSGSRIRSANKSARLSFVGHIQFLPESSGVLTWAKNHVSNVYLK